jgi:hypothetical protein
MKFSKTTGHFYPKGMVAPDDAIDVTQAEHDAALNRYVLDSIDVIDGKLVIISAPTPTSAQLLLAAQEEQISTINRACAAAITGGFQSSALGKPHTYPSSQTDQLNLGNNVISSLLPNLPASWTTPQICCDEHGVWAYLPHSTAQIQKAGIDVKAAIIDRLTKKASLQAQIEAAIDIAAVQAINW